MIFVVALNVYQSIRINEASLTGNISVESINIVYHPVKELPSRRTSRGSGTHLWRSR